MNCRIGTGSCQSSIAWRSVEGGLLFHQAPAEGARLPFWKGETKGRDLRTSLAFGRILGELEKACRDGELEKALEKLGLDESASVHASGFITRQIQATEGLPDDRTIVVEHFKDSTGSHQVMVHALFGRRVNGPLSLVLRHTMHLSIGWMWGVWMRRMAFFCIHTAGSNCRKDFYSESTRTRYGRCWKQSCLIRLCSA